MRQVQTEEPIELDPLLVLQNLGTGLDGIAPGSTLASVRGYITSVRSQCIIPINTLNYSCLVTKHNLKNVYKPDKHNGPLTNIRPPGT